MKRIIAFVLSVVMLISVLPAQQLFAGADEYHYFELDTDGIDAGADYLIVSAKSEGEAKALRNGTTLASGVSVTISGQTIESFANDGACIWTFGGTESGTVKKLLLENQQKVELCKFWLWNLWPVFGGCNQ